MRDPRYRVVKVKYDRRHKINPAHIVNPIHNNDTFSTITIQGQAINMAVADKYIDEREKTATIIIEIIPLGSVHKLRGRLDNGVIIQFYRKDITKITIAEYVSLPDDMGLHPLILEGIMESLFHGCDEFIQELMGN